MIESWRRTVILLPGASDETRNVRTFLKKRGVRFAEGLEQCGQPRLLVSGIPFDGLDEIQHAVNIYGL